VYCAGDAKAGYELVMAIAELLEIPPELLAQEVGGPISVQKKQRVCTEFVTTHISIVKIADAYATSDMSDLTDQEKKWLTNLGGKKNSVRVEIRVEETHQGERIRRKRKEIF
jgi:hypothetical protein